MADMVFSKEELLGVAKQMVDYSDLLAGYIAQYRSILQYIQAQGIVDDAVCTALTNLGSAIQPYETSISAIGGSAMGIVIQTASNLDTLDNYTYPEGNFEEVASALAGFLG